MIAGAVASFAMDRFQAAAGALLGTGGGSEPATEKAADALSQQFAGHDVDAAAKPLAGQAIHYGLGIGLGAAYGIAAEFRPAVTAGCGSAFGLGTATLLGEGAVPAAGLGEVPGGEPQVCRIDRDVAERRPGVGLYQPPRSRSGDGVR